MERENERKPLGFLQIWYVEREGERVVGMCAFKYINFGFFTKLKLNLACFLFLFLIPHLSVLQNSSPFPIKKKKKEKKKKMCTKALFGTI